MGATKISEKIFSSLADEIKDMNISIRFGKVLILMDQLYLYLISR